MRQIMSFDGVTFRTFRGLELGNPSDIVEFARRSAGSVWSGRIQLMQEAHFHLFFFLFRSITHLTEMKLVVLIANSGDWVAINNQIKKFHNHENVFYILFFWMRSHSFNKAYAEFLWGVFEQLEQL